MKSCKLILFSNSLLLRHAKLGGCGASLLFLLSSVPGLRPWLRRLLLDLLVIPCRWPLVLGYSGMCRVQSAQGPKWAPTATPYAVRGPRGPEAQPRGLPAAPLNSTFKLLAAYLRPSLMKVRLASQWGSGHKGSKKNQLWDVTAEYPGLHLLGFPFYSS